MTLDYIDLLVDSVAVRSDCADDMSSVAGFELIKSFLYILSGLIRDVTGQYDLAFYLATAASLIMALLTVVSAVISARRLRQGWTQLK